MNYKENIKPISYIKANAAEMLNQVNETRNPIIITQNGEARAILIDPDSFQDMQNTLCILKLIAQSEKEKDEGKLISNEDVFSDLKAKIGCE